MMISKFSESQTIRLKQFFFTEKPDNKQLQFVYCRVDRRSEGCLQDIHARFLDPEFIYHFLSSTLRGH